MKKISVILLSFSILSGIFAQPSLIKKGDAQMKKYRFDRAAEFFKKAADRDANDVVAWEKLGMAFLMMNDYQSGEFIYQKLAMNPLANHVNKFYYAQMLRNNGKYEEAQKAYDEFAKAEPKDQRTDEFKNFLEEVKPLAEDFKTYELTLLPENSPASDFGVAYNFGNMVFTSNREAGGAVKNLDFRNGKGFYDLYQIGQATQTNAAPLAKLKGKANSKFNDGPAAFTRDGKEMIFTRTNKRKGEDGSRKLGLYHATWDKKKGWINVEPLPFNSNTYNVAHPSLSKDGSKLFFISDMTGTLGETDIWMSLKNGTTWEAPVNLGKEINTPGREMFPFIADNGMLFFSSDARVGLGGLDIYSALPDGRKFTSVINLGAPVNTNYDDFGYVVDETSKNGFMVTNRPGGKGDDDIYKFLRKGESICGTVMDKKSKAVIENAKIVASASDGHEVRIRTNMKGDFCIDLLVDKNYKLTAQKEEYHDYETSINVKTENNPRQIIAMNAKGEIELTVDVSQKGDGKIDGATAFLINKNTGEIFEQKSGADGIIKFDLKKDQEYDLKVVKKLHGQNGVYDKFVKAISTMGFTESQNLTETAELSYYDSTFVFDLKNVFFDLNSSKIKPEATKDLDKVAEVMKTFADMQIELSAHTDARGNATYNLGLSVLRANACVDYLTSKDIDKARLIAIGYGEMRIKNKCKDGVQCTETEHSVNRRTEFKVVKFD